MRLKNADGEWFELRIGGYQFPDLVDDHWDSNWLFIDIDVRAMGYKWISRDPCLTTVEVGSVCLWLDDLADGKEVPAEQEFIEPHLVLECIDVGQGRATIRIFFSAECRPPSAPWAICPDTDTYVDFELGMETLRAWADDLRRQLERYPPRAGAKAVPYWRQ